MPDEITQLKKAILTSYGTVCEEHIDEIIAALDKSSGENCI